MLGGGFGVAMRAGYVLAAVAIGVLWPDEQARKKGTRRKETADCCWRGEDSLS